MATIDKKDLIPAPALDHIGIAVADLEAAVDTWKTLGFDVKAVEDLPGFGVRVAFLPMQSGSVELVCPTSPDAATAKFIEKKGPGIHHVLGGIVGPAIQVGSAVLLVFRREQIIRPRHPPRVLCGGRYPRRAGAPFGGGGLACGPRATKRGARGARGVHPPKKHRWGACGAVASRGGLKSSAECRV